jgi:hypothetical protein
MLCDQVIFEINTQKPYLLGVFTGVSVDAVPSSPQRFDIFAALTDGLGEVTMVLSVVRLETNQEIYAQTLKVKFPDPLKVVNLRFRVRHLIYDAPGTYLFAISADEQELAARRVRVYK